MSNLTKEECMIVKDKLTRLAYTTCDCELGKIYEVSVCDVILEKLINEHFDNPPLELEELKEDMWVWDNYEQMYKRIKFLYSHLSNGMRYKCVSYYPVDDGDGIEINLKHNRFELGRFYANEVKEGE